MAKKRFKIKDKLGNPVDYDISSASVTIDVEGKSLDVKLSELVTAIASAVKRVTYNGAPTTPDQQGNININQVQPNWTESNPQQPSFIQGKPNSVVNEISYDPQSRKVKQRRNGVVEDVFTLPDGGSTIVPDAALSDTSENAVQNKVIKAYVDAVSQRIDTLLGSGNVQGAIDTFNEVKAFLDGIDTSDPTLANQLLALSNAISAVQTSLAGKVDKETGKSLMTDAERTKLQGLPTGATLVSTYATKDEVDEKQDSLVGETLFTVNGQTVTLGQSVTVSGEKGEQGVAGNCVLTNGEDILSIIVNNLIDGGAGNILSAEMGLLLKRNIDVVQANIQRLYTKLGNIAFWTAQDRADAEPLPVTWAVPDNTVVIVNNFDNVELVYGGELISGDSIMVPSGQVTDIIVRPVAGYSIATIAANVGGSALTPINNNNGTYTLRFSVSGNQTLEISGTTALVQYTITYDTVMCSQGSGSPTSISYLATATIQFTASSGYELRRSMITVDNADIVSFDNTSGTLVIANPTGNVTVHADAKTLKFLRGWYISDRGSEPINESPADTSKWDARQVTLSDYIHLPGTALQDIYVNYGKSRNNTSSVNSKVPSMMTFFRKEDDGSFTTLGSYSWAGVETERTVTATALNGNEKLVQAMNAEKLYIRSSLALTEINGNTLMSTCKIRFGNTVLFDAGNTGTYPYDVVADTTIFDTYNPFET
jgi:hypothetical protein